MGARFLLLSLACVGVFIADHMAISPFSLPLWSNGVWALGFVIGVAGFTVHRRRMTDWRKWSRAHGLALDTPGLFAQLLGVGHVRLSGEYAGSGLSVVLTQSEGDAWETTISVPSPAAAATQPPTAWVTDLQAKLDAHYGRAVSVQWGGEVILRLRHEIPTAKDIEASVALIRSTTPP